LVVAQVALGLLLLVSAGLWVRSAQNGLQLDSGLDEESLLLLSLNLELMGSDAPEPEVFFTGLLDLLRQTPGVEGVALAGSSPLQGYPRVRVAPSSQEASYGNLMSVTQIGDGYLDAVGIPVLSGRDLIPSDMGGPVRVALLNQAAARRLFPDRDPLGETLSLDEGSEGLEVIGIVGDTRASLFREPEPVVYLPKVLSGSPLATFYIRSLSSPSALRESVKGVVARTAPHLPLERLETAEELRVRMLTPMRMSYLALGFLGAIAVALAGAGLYGVLAYSVNRRSREIGIRMALGAEASTVATMVVGGAFRLLAIGMGIGMALSAGIATLLRGGLFGVSPVDPWTYLRVGGLLSVITLLAALLPALRASRIDPVQTIATE
jgi:putative ABC transport system permease protein